MNVQPRIMLALLLSLGAIQPLPAGPDGARVENVQASVERDTLYITYDLHADSDDDRFDVEVEVRRKGAPDFRYTLRDARGAVGPDQRPGRRKLIIWDPRTMAKLWPADDGFVFEIHATLSPGGWGKWPWIGAGVVVVAGAFLLIDRPPPPPPAPAPPDVFPSPPGRP